MVSRNVLIIGMIVLFGCFLTASSLKCYKCEGSVNKPTCTGNDTCGTGKTQCLSEVEKDDDGKLSYQRRCAIPGECTAKEGVCSLKKLASNIKECAYTCCKTDNCNDKWPSFDSGVKVTSGLVAIGVTVFLALFVM